MDHSPQHELEHAARWVRYYRSTKNAEMAEKWQTRWDEVYDRSCVMAAVASDGEVLDAQQSPWVVDQADASLLRPEPSVAVNRTGRSERVIRPAKEKPDHCKICWATGPCPHRDDPGQLVSA